MLWDAVVGLNDTLPHIENTVWIDSSPQPIGLVIPNLLTKIRQLRSCLGEV